MAAATTKKGYWVIHMQLKIKDHALPKFFAHLAAANEKSNYGGVTRVFAPVTKTLQGDPVEFAMASNFLQSKLLKRND